MACIFLCARLLVAFTSELVCIFGMNRCIKLAGLVAEGWKNLKIQIDRNVAVDIYYLFVCLFVVVDDDDAVRTSNSINV